MKTTDPITVVCADITEPLLMPDNLTGPCDECFRMVQFRPYAPRGPKLCFECAIPVIEAGAELTTTQRMLEDAWAYLQKQRH